MKLKLKLLAAALGFALAGGANAAITQSASGNGELFFTIYDMGADLSSNADDRAYVRDLGSFLGSFGVLNDWAAPTGSIPALNASKNAPGTAFSVGADSNLSSFLAASTDLARLQWNIGAFDSQGADRVLITGATMPAAPNVVQFRTWGSVGADVYLATVNPALTGNSATYAGSAAAISQWGSNIGGKTAFSTAAGVGDSLGFYLISERAATGSTVLTDVQTYAHQWTLGSDGTLTYAAAVPEPGTWAMLAAGLLMIGGIARRRLS